ncbi:tetratricopeptide repeat protein [Sorangium sp. So ce291]|uniref:tetratricopeptide repeat protein n=1 Tax=Sorangium sp. So ce291 TaxID=3133294 RepID=UPI003F634895
MTATPKSEIDLDRLPAILAAQVRGEPIGPDDAELLRRAEQEDPELRGEAPLWAALGKLGDPRGDGRELSDAALLQQVLARAHGEPAPASRPRPRAAPRQALRRGLAGSIAGVAVAATLLAALAAELIDGPAEAPPPAPSGNEVLDPSGAPRAAPGLPAPAPPAEPSPGAANDGPAAAGAANEPAAAGAANDGPAAAGAANEPAAAGAANEPAAAGAANEPAAAGAANEPAAAGAANEPAAAGASAAASEASRGAGAAANGPAAAGGVEARERAPQPPRQGAEEGSMSAEALLVRAQSRLGQGKSAEASAAYRALLAQHPSSPEARAALVSLGQIALQQGKAAEALGYFERYLAGAGPLAAEARVGRVQCLRRLGRTADERAAIADFLSRHGESVHAPRLRARLAELGGK